MADKPTMIPLDYGRSFLIGTWPGNEVRFWIESRTRIVDERTGASEDYLQAASCKSEDTFAKRDLFYEDNYDFLPVFGPEHGVIFRRKAWLNADYKSTPRTEDMWGGPVRHLCEAEHFEELATNEAILAATRAFAPIVAQTEIRDAATTLRAVIECPVKTLNTNRERMMYQVDTGPVAFPDLSMRCDRHVERISLAFVAFNAPGFADFVIEAPTPTGGQNPPGEDAGAIYHYSRRVSLEAANRLYAVRPS